MLQIATLGWILIAVYLGIGSYSFFWIRRDAEFRTGSWLLIGIPSIFLWPAMVLIWMLARGEEHLTDMAAKQSHRHYLAYMRDNKVKDLFTYFPTEAPQQEGKANDGSAMSGQSTRTEKVQTAFKDFNLDTLIAEGKLDEALAAAKNMRKVAIQTQENDRVAYYEDCIKRIEDGKRMELD